MGHVPFCKVHAVDAGNAERCFKPMVFQSIQQALPNTGVIFNNQDLVRGHLQADLLKNLMNDYKIGNTRSGSLHIGEKLGKIGNAMIQILELALLYIHPTVLLLDELFTGSYQA